MLFSGSRGVRVLAFGTILAMGGATTAGAVLTREVITTALTNPLQVTAPRGDPDRLFVVERAGLIRIIDKDTNSILGTPFLDVNDSPNTDIDSQGEGGLMSMAFHPSYSSNGFFFVFYTTSLPGTGFTTRVSRFTVSGNPDIADPATEVVFFELDDPFPNHNGGMIAFRPGDSGQSLYIGLGDGGSFCDPNEWGQDLTSKFGKFLRVNVNAGPSGDLENPFAPASNPFVGVAGDDLIWSLGWRNPYRWFFDRSNGDLYVGDVGQNTREEISYEAAGDPGGGNYGWNAREGFIPTPCGNAEPTLPGMIDPLHDYDHEGTGANRSVTGGPIYRGVKYATLYGRYYFADFSTGQVWSFVREGMGITDLQEHTSVLNPNGENIGGFGEDADGDIYILEFSGTMARITDPDSPGMDLDQDLLEDQYETDTNTFVSATDTGTDPNDNDSDDDDVIDGVEVALGTDPNDPFDFPSLPVSLRWLAVTTVLVVAAGGAWLVRRRRAAQ
jgi:glucose/arabinose dehydrogenase